MAYLEMKEITKIFPGVLANDRVSLAVDRGEIHALLGENGAGKSTLMNILYGMYQQDEGEILLDGKAVQMKSPRDATRLGIGMVHQHFMLIPALTVIENVVLGLKDGKGLMNLRASAEKVQRQAAKFNMRIDPFTEVWKLSVGEQQRLEIIKALYRGAKLLVLDEPTAVLTPKEVEDLFTMVRQLANEGYAIIFITHKLAEVMEICDRCTVLRQGKLEATVCVKDIENREELATLMVGHHVDLVSEKLAAHVGKTMLNVQGLCSKNDKGLPALKGVDLEIRAREIVGVAGVDGNGQSELVECLTGLRKIEEGKVEIDGVDSTKLDTRKVLQLGVSHIPEDRHKRGMFKDMSVKENLILVSYHQPPYSKAGFINWKWVARHSQELCAEYQVKTPSIEEKAGKLSGGNQQKFVVGREIERHPKLLIAMHPSRGLDIGATKYIHSRLLQGREEGMAILLVSTELDEVLEMSDRIIVMYEGRVIGQIHDPKTITREKIGLLMAGHSEPVQQNAE